MRFSRSFIFFFAFLEGAAVMGVEFLGAKILAPFFGTSLQVWTSVIGITMLALALGYYFGGRLSALKDGRTLLSRVIFAGSLFLLFMPVLSAPVMLLVSGMSINSGSVIASVLLLLPATLCYGMINPVLITNSSKGLEESGNHTGIVYAASTLGAVAAVLVLGFYVIPFVGIRIPVYLLASILGISLFFLSGKEGSARWVSPSFIMGAVLLFSGLMATFTLSDQKTEYKTHRIRYESEGLLGQVSVIDHNHDTPKRMLYVNGISQTNEDLATKISNGLYVHRISVTGSFKPEGSRALILGLGGGSLAKEFINLKFKVDVCEIDKRMAEISTDYFGLDTSGLTFIVDDARHFINTCTKKYDIIVFDIALGEIQPSHLFTKEAFGELKRLLSNDQSFVFFHYTDRGHLASRSLCKTLQSSGYLVKEFVPKPGLEDDKIFIALTAPPNTSLFIPGRQNKCCERAGKREMLVALQPVNTDGAIILSDDKPLLDLINQETTTYYRKLTIKELLLKRMKGDNF